MYKTGVYFGRFLPPHRGHLYQMIEASTRCEKLLVVISDNADQTREICRRDGIPEISYRLRKQWISQQIQDITHIGVRVLDETDIPVYPEGWELWSQRMREVVGEPIDAFFVGDMEYGETLARYFPESKVELFIRLRDQRRVPGLALEAAAAGQLQNTHYEACEEEKKLAHGSRS